MDVSKASFMGISQVDGFGGFKEVEKWQDVALGCW